MEGLNETNPAALQKMHQVARVNQWRHAAADFQWPVVGIGGLFDLPPSYEWGGTNIFSKMRYIFQQNYGIETAQ